MATINVSTTAQLKTALSSAHAGDTILMASGTYSGLNLQNYHFTTPVTIQSADAAHPAAFLDLTVRSSSGLNFNNLELNASHATADWPFRVYSSSNVNFSHLDVHGSLDSNPQDDFSGLLISGSSNVTVSNSNFEQLKTALAYMNDSHVQLTGNAFHDLALDGVHGGGSSYVTISGNSFTNFYAASGAHPDAIQFWTTNTTTSAHDIVVSDNVIVRGDGSQMQGIFITDQVGTLPYQNVTISGNMLVGTRYHGITIDHAAHVAVSGNIVAGLPDMLSWIRLEDVNGATVTNNTAGELTQVSDSNVSVSGFTTALPTLSQAEQMLDQWLATHATVASVYGEVSTGVQSGSTTSATTSATTSGTTSATGTISYDQTLVGTAANDVLTGGAGDDRLDGRAGADKMSGGTGNDIYYVDNSGDAVTENAGAGSDTVVSTISYRLGANVERLTLSGSANIGGIGNTLSNKIIGNAGANVIDGGAGNDTLIGGAGADKITGGAGNDTMTGGTGNDLFVFHNGDLGSDRITDFTHGQDRMYLSGVDANTILAGDQNFHFVGTSAFSHTAGELHYQEVSGSTYLSGDTNGDGVADFTIHLDGLHALTTSDFFL